MAALDWKSFEEKINAWEIYYSNRCRTLSPVERAKWYIKYAPYDEWLLYKNKAIELTGKADANPEDYAIDILDVLCQH